MVSVAGLIRRDRGMIGLRAALTPFSNKTELSTCTYRRLRAKFKHLCLGVSNPLIIGLPCNAIMVHPAIIPGCAHTVGGEVGVYLLISSINYLF